MGEMDTRPLPPREAEPNNLDKPPLVLGASTGSFFIENILSVELLFTKGPSGAAVNA